VLGVGARRRLLSAWKPERQDAVAEVGLDELGLKRLGQLERAAEGPIATLDAVRAVVLARPDLPALTADGECRAVESDADVLGLKAGKLHVDHDPFSEFIEVHRWFEG
jgi:hypothetical protein